MPTGPGAKSWARASGWSAGGVLVQADRGRVLDHAVQAREPEERDLQVLGVPLDQAQRLHALDLADDVAGLEVAERDRLRGRGRGGHRVVEGVLETVDRGREAGRRDRDP